ncbi:MAG TPA: nuclear transport factor 2 family protein [Vicinamibacterales bacterium]|nr:nuclear transport factor 2 family protein [Vicinamibacterales bacterium]
MRVTVVIGSLLIVFGAGAVSGVRARQSTADEQAIRTVVSKAYVSGVFIARDETAVRSGFHPDFVLTVYDDGKVIVAPLDMWLDRLKLDGVRSQDAVAHEVDFVDITGRTALIKLRLTVNGRHRYTDYMGLYRFDDGWRIVNKVYEDH